jgi:hypothetical protein
VVDGAAGVEEDKVARACGSRADPEVGSATAGNNYFRQIGASLGSAIVGSLFVARLTSLLAERMSGAGGAAAGSSNSFTPVAVRRLPEAVRNVVIGAYNDALTPVFLSMVPLVLIAEVLLTFVKEKPLATTIERDILPETLEIDGMTLVPLGQPHDSPDQPEEQGHGRADMALLRG